MDDHRVSPTGPVSTHDEPMPCECCAEDCTESAPASNGGRLCEFCVQDCHSFGPVLLWPWKEEDAAERKDAA